MTILPVCACGLVGGCTLSVVLCEEGNVGLLVGPGPIVVDGVVLLDVGRTGWVVLNNSIRNTNYAHER